jgi:uncharacterized membrane protein
MTCRARLACSLALAPLLAVPAAATETSQQEVMAVVAAIVRAQGMACTSPATVARDSEASKPGEPVYVIACKEATYTVRVVPDQASVITRQ